MATPSFEIKTLHGMTLPIQELNDPEMTVKELTDMVVNHLEYPLFEDDGQKEVEYFLENSKGNKLPAAERLSRVGVLKDEVLTLKASTQVALPDRRVSQMPPAVKGKVNVYVQLLDLNRTEVETFDTDRKVRDVLNNVIAKYRLPARDERLKEGKVYELFSKAAGKALHEGMTLRDAEIPNQDTLRVSTKEIPGAEAPCTTRSRPA